MPGRLVFFTPKAQLAFKILKQVFSKALMITHFKPNWYIWLKTNLFGWTIGVILSQLFLEMDNWYLVTYFSRMIISAKICYTMYNQKLPAIVKLSRPETLLGGL